jgi:hypothetical protein
MPDRSRRCRQRLAVKPRLHKRHRPRRASGTGRAGRTRRTRRASRAGATGRAGGAGRASRTCGTDPARRALRPDDLLLVFLRAGLRVLAVLPRQVHRLGFDHPDGSGRQHIVRASRWAGPRRGRSPPWALRVVRDARGRRPSRLSRITTVRKQDRTLPKAPSLAGRAHGANVSPGATTGVQTAILSRACNRWNRDRHPLT